MIIKKVSDKMYEIESKNNTYTVIFQKKSGRTLVLCSCLNGTKFINSPALCKHKELAIVTRFNERREKWKQKADTKL